jgi:hypothetical protein
MHPFPHPGSEPLPIHSLEIAMKNPLVSSKPAIGRIAAAALVVVSGAAAHAATGARVVVQDWDYRNPDVVGGHVLVDDPDIVSRSVQKAWDAARGVVCAQLKAKMGASKAAAGQTLYDIDCQLDPNAGFTVQSAGSNMLRAVFTIKGNSITASSTVPDPLGKEFDPRFSLTLDASLAVVLAVQADPAHTLKATSAKFTLGSASVDSHNAPADVAKFIADDLIPFFGGPNFKRMAEDAVNGVSLNLAGLFDAQLPQVNAMLRGPSDKVRVNVWGSANRITVAFGPRELTPPGGGTVKGAVRWDPAQFAAAPNCASFGLQASVRTGPGQLLSPDDFTQVGPAPTRNVGSVSMAPTAGSDRQCNYVIAGAAAGWPNRIDATAKNIAPKSGGTFVTKRVVMQADGWNGVAVADASNRDYRVATGYTANSVATVQRGPGDPIGPIARPGDAVMNPGVLAQGAVGNVSTPALGGQAATIRPVGAAAAVVQPGQAVSLNPQPLPPKWGAVGTQPGAAVSLNPQPLPPKTGSALVSQPMAGSVDVAPIPRSAFGR